MFCVSGKPYTVDLHGQDLGDISGQRFVRAYLAGCTIGRSRGAEFINCNLRGARFTSPDIRDYLSMTPTLNCDTWENLELPQRAFDALLKLLSISACGEEKREGLRALIEPTWLRILDRQFPDLEI